MLLLAPVTGALPVDVAVLHLDLRLGDPEADRGLLSGDERARADRFAFDDDRRRFTAARASLRRALAERLGADPAALSFTVEPGGKPRLAAPHDRLRFNLSHAGHDAVLALSFAREVGADVERRDRPVELERLARRHLNEAERVLVSATGDPDARRRAFLRAWVRKEALAKALGVGIATDLRALDPAAHPGFTTLDLAAPEGLAAAVAFARP